MPISTNYNISFRCGIVNRMKMFFGSNSQCFFKPVGLTERLKIDILKSHLSTFLSQTSGVFYPPGRGQDAWKRRSSFLE